MVIAQFLPAQGSQAAQERRTFNFLPVNSESLHSPSGMRVDFARAAPERSNTPLEESSTNADDFRQVFPPASPPSSGLYKSSSGKARSYFSPRSNLPTRMISPSSPELEDELLTGRQRGENAIGRPLLRSRNASLTAGLSSIAQEEEINVTLDNTQMLEYAYVSNAFAVHEAYLGL